MMESRYLSALSLAILVGCSGSDDGPAGSGGTQQSTGGQSSSQSTSSTGGDSSPDSASTGGKSAGTQATGGKSNAATGGAQHTGGKSAAQSSTGGSSVKATGGASATGGKSGSSVGGKTGVTGGASAVGGSSASSSGGSAAMGGSTAAGGNSAATGGSVASTGGKTGTGGGTSCVDECPTSSTGYIQVGCKKRFMYGANYAWQNFGTDFGGFAKWSKKGVAADKSTYTAAMQDMKDNGVDVIRWWVFPNLDNSDGIAWDSDTATGLGGTALADFEAALEIAASLDMHIQLTPFSFDDFKTENTRRLDKILGDSAKTTALIDKVIKPMAAAIEASPNKDRMISWDVINEPEWAITGSDGYGDQDFGPDKTCSPVAFPVIEAFVKNVITALHANSSAPVTVGGAATKWAKAWSKVGIDYYTFHMYGWVNDWFPYDQPPSYYGITDKQVNIGEFPFSGLPASTQRGTGAVDYVTMVNKLFSIGYAGAQGWAVTDPDFNWSGSKVNVKAFATDKGCMVQF